MPSAGPCEPHRIAELRACAECPVGDDVYLEFHRGRVRVDLDHADVAVVLVTYSLKAISRGVIAVPRRHRTSRSADSAIMISATRL